MKYTQADEELETLIELNGQRYWIKNHIYISSASQLLQDFWDAVNEIIDR